jgi:2-polyprenyl-3-methyl-5-hydroxy-6-metoxy-1,4-benzoquinol methylase
MFKLWREIKELYEQLTSGSTEGLAPTDVPVRVTLRDIELSEGLSGDRLQKAVDSRARRIYEDSKGTSREAYEAEALGFTLDEYNGYHIKAQIRRIHAIMEFVGTGKKILDCAGGSGYIANLLKDAGNDVTVLDFSDIHLLRAKWLRGLKTANGRVESIPFPDHSYDVVIMAEVLEHCEYLSVPIKEAERVCREDGQIIITIPVCPNADLYGEHLKSMRAKLIVDDQHLNDMLVLSVKNIKNHLADFRTRGRGVVAPETNYPWRLDGLGSLVIKGMHGLGDNIGQRNFIKGLGFRVYLETPWPQLYADLPNVSLLPCATSLRTQVKNQKSNNFKYSEPPTGRITEIEVMYDNDWLRTGSIFGRFSSIFGGVVPKTFDVPEFPRPSFLPAGRKIAVIRPVIQRKEWFGPARNPDPEYMYQASEALRAEGYFTISVCDLEDGEEWIEGREPLADLKFHHGELRVEELLGLVQNSDVLVGSPGWMVHASLATKKPMFVIAGGYGGCNAPERIADSLYVDNSMLSWAIPDNYCECQDMEHNCSKTITDFTGKMATWLESVK